MIQPALAQLAWFTGLNWYWRGCSYDAALPGGGWISLDMTSWDCYGTWRCHTHQGRYWYGATWQEAVKICLDGEGI